LNAQSEANPGAEGRTRIRSEARTQQTSTQRCRCVRSHAPLAARAPFPPTIGRFDRTPSTEVHSERPLQLLRLLRTSRWRLMKVASQYVYRPHRPHLPGGHRRSSLPPDFVHRCARHARTHAQLAAGCAVGQARDESAAAATANDAPATTAQVPAAQDSPGYAAPRTRTLDPAFHPAAVCSPAMPTWLRMPARTAALRRKSTRVPCRPPPTVHTDT